jgi:hypothetical protein
MLISHVGQASLLAHNSKKLHLLNVLRVPSATRSLLSVPQLTHDNNVFAEFHHFPFSYRIGIQEMFCLEVASVTTCTRLTRRLHFPCRMLPRCSVVFVCHLCTGMRALVTLLLP